MKKNNLTVNRLKNRLKEDLEKEALISPKEEMLKEDDLKDIIDFNLIDSISSEKEIKTFLKEQTIKLFSIQSKNALLLGEVFSTVFDKLSSPGSEEGIYEKWLGANSFNKTTAWRYRQRYALYSKVDEDKKIIIATVPYGVINTLLKDREIEEGAKIINTCTDKSELLNLIEKNKEVKAVEKKEKSENFEIKNYFGILENIEEKLSKFDQNKRNEIKKHLDILQKLLNS